MTRRSSKAKLLWRGRGPGHALTLPLHGLRNAAEVLLPQIAAFTGIDMDALLRWENLATLDGLEVWMVRAFLAGCGCELEMVAVSKHGHRIAVGGTVSDAQARAKKKAGAKRRAKP